nr:CoA ester lyase [Planctomonas sp. JC2975]
MLFCPGDRPDRFGKALGRADAVILDLEDGVASADRPAAREAVTAFARELSEADPDAVRRVIVRVNSADTDDFAEDLGCLRGTPFGTVMLAKTASVDQVARLAEQLDGIRIIALCETAAGVLAAPEIARHPSVVGLMWGAEDLVVSLGGSSSRRDDGSYRDVARFARSAVLLAAAVARADAIDAVHVDLDDLVGLGEEAADAVASGFAATACLHPAQVAVVRAAYRPTAQRIDWARRLLAAAELAPGAFRFEGGMVDEPLLAQAGAVLRQAERAGAVE